MRKVVTLHKGGRKGLLGLCQTVRMKVLPIFLQIGVDRYPQVWYAVGAPRLEKTNQGRTRMGATARPAIRELLHSILSFLRGQAVLVCAACPKRQNKKRVIRSDQPGARLFVLCGGLFAPGPPPLDEEEPHAADRKGEVVGGRAVQQQHRHGAALPQKAGEHQIEGGFH